MCIRYCHYGPKYSNIAGRARLGSALRGMDGQLESGTDGFDSGRQSSTSHRPMSRMTGSRPGSMLDGRPGSSMRKGRRDIEHKERTRKMGNTEVHTLRNTHYTPHTEVHTLRNTHYTPHTEVQMHRIYFHFNRIAEVAPAFQK